MSWWQTSVTLTSGKPFTEDEAFDLIDALANNSAAMSVARDLTGGTVTLSVEAQSSLDAATSATTLVANAAKQIIGEIEVVGLEVLTEEAVDAKLAQPLFPEVVGYAEIAEMAGVTRQRARQFAALDGFPVPVIETAQGPLMGKHAVERWLEIRNTHTGRPRKERVDA